MARYLIAGLLALSACLGCSSTKQEKADVVSSPSSPPGLATMEKFWGQNELGGLDK